MNFERCLTVNFFGISNEIECIVEDNKLKHGKFLPGMNIPIVSRSAIKEKPDVIVCDIMMPVLDGYGVLHIFTQSPDLQNIPFIF